MTDSLIDYDALVQDALRGVVREILSQVADDGLPGEHHFYVAFRTRAEGVDIPDHLKERYPDEMTIVIQHRFWGLTVHQDRFEIGLSFNQQPEHLTVPYDAIVGFVDPSVQFALQFQEQEADNDDIVVPEAEAIVTTADVEQGAEETRAKPNAPDAGDGANVVTLDAFRKKT